MQISKIKIKPLEWRAMWAETPFGCYKIDEIMSEPINGPGSPRSDEEVSYQPTFNGMDWGNIFGSVDMAKEYCQEHFNERIRSALVTPTDAGKVDYDDDVTAEAVEKLRLKAAPVMGTKEWVQIAPIPTPEQPLKQGD